MKKNTGERIREILYGYMKEPSTSGTAAEQYASAYFMRVFREFGTFTEITDREIQDACVPNARAVFGEHPIPEDPFGRSVTYAMVRGESNHTVVLIHHNDVVDIEDFKDLRPLAYDPDSLAEALEKRCDSIEADAAADLKSGEWIFGRGGCDMKAGGAIQMGLLAEYAEHPEALPVTVIVVAVPDEENLSAGMREAAVLLADLADALDLKYDLMINSEPNQRITPTQGIFSFGSIGKIMPVVYVRGALAHASHIFEGLNPMHVLAGIIRKTECSMEFSDSIGSETAPPPTWLYAKDSKELYDVSLPLSARGALSVLTLAKTPAEVMKILERISSEAFAEVIEDMNRNYKIYLERRGESERTLPWKVRVLHAADLIALAKCDYEKSHRGESFDTLYREWMKELNAEIAAGRKTMITGTYALFDKLFDQLLDLSPCVVLGLVPPYYPNSANVLRTENRMDGLYEFLREYVNREIGEDYVKENYFTGISDLSYCGIADAEGTEAAISRDMPFYGNLYRLPLDSMQKISMPCVNIGPWGKDFHRITERVYAPDVCKNTPKILDYVIRNYRSFLNCEG